MTALIDDIEALINTWHEAAVYYRAQGSKASTNGDSLMATDYHVTSNAYSTAALELSQLLKRHVCVTA